MNKKKRLSAIDLNNDVIGEISEICEPLFRQTPVTTFSYLRFYNNGKLLRLSSNPQWTEEYYETLLYHCQDDYYNESKYTPNTYNFHYRTGQPKDRIAQMLFQSNIWNTCTVCKRNKEYIECYFFGASQTQRETVFNFYLNHQKNLIEFSENFNYLQNDLVNISDTNYLTQSSVFPYKYTIWEENNLLLNTKKYRLISQDKDFYFSDTEAKLLQEIAQGQSYKTIKRNLAINASQFEHMAESFFEKMDPTYMKQLPYLFHKREYLHVFEPVPGNL